MTPKSLTHRLVQHEGLNFLLTNRIPRATTTRWMGWYSRIQSPLLTRLSIAVWRLFSDLDLSDARQQRFRSVHECFTRELRPGARTIDANPRVLASPCDAIVGACGQVAGLRAWQAKGFDYSLAQLFGSDAAAAPWRDGSYATLRLTSGMYHRFHAPHDARIEHVTYLSGDTWNVNPIALKRVERLYCLNERATIRLRLSSGHMVALVPVAAILVASLRLHSPDLRFHLRYDGPNEVPCDVPVSKGAELGWFEHGSTILVFAPPGFALSAGIEPGRRIRMGEALMTLPPSQLGPHAGAGIPIVSFVRLARDQCRPALSNIGFSMSEFPVPMTPPFDASSLTMTEIIRLQTMLSKELARRFERPAALAFTDIVESSSHFAHFGDEAGRRLQQLHFDMLEQSMATGTGENGRIVDTAGDGAFACFASAGAAVQAMMALQNRITHENVSRPREHQLSVRVGLHWGHVLTDGVHVTGDAVNLCARLVATARAGEVRLSRDLFQELSRDLRHRCRPLGQVSLKGIARRVELLALVWRDPARFPSEMVIRESGERIVLPAQDTVCFGRGEVVGVTTANDVALALPDALVAKQVSRRHFELRAHPDGYLLRALTSQPTEVDGVTMHRDQELPIRPGSCVKLADVMTLDFSSPSLADEGTIDETLLRPRAVTIRPFVQAPTQFTGGGHTDSLSELRS